MKELTNELILKNINASAGIGVSFIMLAFVFVFVGIIVTICLCVTLKKENKSKIILITILSVFLISAIPFGMGVSTLTIRPISSEYTSDDITVVKTKVVDKSKKRNRKVYKALGRRTTYKYYIEFEYGNEKVSVTESQYNKIKLGDEYYIVVNSKKSNQIVDYYPCDKYDYKK